MSGLSASMFPEPALDKQFGRVVDHLRIAAKHDLAVFWRQLEFGAFLQRAFDEGSGNAAWHGELRGLAANKWNIDELVTIAALHFVNAMLIAELRQGAHRID